MTIRHSYRQILAQQAGQAHWPAMLLVATIAVFIALAPPSASGLLLASGGLLLVVLIRPWLGLSLLALAIPFAALRPLPLGGLPLDAADLLVALVVAAWLARGVAQRRLVLPQSPLSIPLLLFIGALLLSLPGAISYREALPELLKWIEVLALYWCVAAVLPARRSWWLLAGLLAAGVGQALLGLYQFVTQTGPEPFILLGRFMRAYGAFRQPNPYAGYLGLVAPLAISLALWAWTPRSRRPGQPAGLGWLRVALPVAALLIVSGLMVSWSRGAWIAFALAALAVVLAHARRFAPLLLLGGGIALLILAALGAVDLLPAALIERLSDLQAFFGLVDVGRVEVTDANFSVIERLAHWEAAISMWADRPWFGVGAGNYAIVYPAHALPRWPEPLGHAHNVYLNFGAETGLVGLLAYLALWIASGWQALRAAAHPDRFVAAIGAGVLGALVHATVHNAFDNLWVQHIYLHLGLLIGLLAVVTGGRQSGFSRPQGRHQRRDSTSSP